MAEPKLILPEALRKRRRPDPVDRTDIASAQQVLGLLAKGFQENMWPDFIKDYEVFGLQSDVAVVYHIITFARARGFGLGLKEAEIAARALVQDLEREITRLARSDKEEDLKRLDIATAEARGAREVVHRIHGVLDKMQIPGV